jgi:hypothetical protein
LHGRAAGHSTSLPAPVLLRLWPRHADRRFRRGPTDWAGVVAASF